MRVRRFIVMGILSLLPGVITGSAAAYWVPVTVDAESPTPVVAGTAQRLEVSWSLPGFEMVTVDVSAITATGVTLPGAPLLREPGRPEVPVVPVTLALPDRGAVQVEILEHRVREIPVAPVLPSRGHLPRTIDPATVIRHFGPFYDGDGVWPVEPVTLGRPFVTAQTRGTTLRLQPFRYDAGRKVLLVTEYIRVALVTGSDPGVNELLVRGAVSPDLAGLRGRLFANPVPVVPAKAAPGTAAPRMLVVVPDDLRAALEPLVLWKTRCGIDVETASPADLGGSASAIAAAVASRYGDPAGLAWVLLVGDMAQVPTLAGGYEGADSDQSYTMVAGDDLWPDLLLGRLPARTAAEVQTQVARLLAYERDAAAGSWYDRAGGVASAEGNPADHERADDLRDDLMAAGFTSVDRVYEDLGAVTADVRTALQQGRSLINYMGHGSGTAWQSVPFDVADVRALDNTTAWPWIVDASCWNGEFARDECLAEAWLRAGTATAPAGAVGVLAATSLLPWTPPIHLQGGVVDALTVGGTRSLGALAYAGLARVLDLYDPLPVAAQVVEQYALFGDPSLLVRTRTPGDFGVTIDRAVGAREGSWHLKVDGPPGSVVALTDGGRLIGRGTVGVDGLAEVAILDAPLGLAALDLTVTGPDMRPHQEVVAVVQGVSAVVVAPVGVRLLGNHPNPFNPVTVIACELDAPGPVHLVVHDVSGRRVRVLARGAVLAAGRQEFIWDGRDETGRRLASGVYLYRLTTARGSVGGRMTLVK